MFVSLSSCVVFVSVGCCHLILPWDFISHTSQLDRVLDFLTYFFVDYLRMSGPGIYNYTAFLKLPYSIEFETFKEVVDLIGLGPKRQLPLVDSGIFPRKSPT